MLEALYPLPYFHPVCHKQIWLDDVGEFSPSFNPEMESFFSELCLTLMIGDHYQTKEDTQ